MIGKRPPQRKLFDVGNVYSLVLDPGSFHGQLAVAGPRLFRDEDFAPFYHASHGRPSVPPAQLALLTLLQHEAGVSDAEAIARSAYDLRWAAVLGRAAGEPLCAKSTFQLFRAHLVLHDGVRLIFEKSLHEAQASGLLKHGPLRIAIDTKPILGRGAVEDTYNLLAHGIRGLAASLAQPAGQEPEDWARAQDLGRYFAGSVKGGADVDWSDAAARKAFLTEIVTDARRVLRLARTLLPALSETARRRVEQAMQLLEQLLLQDIVESPAPPTPPTPPTPAAPAASGDGAAATGVAGGEPGNAAVPPAAPAPDPIASPPVEIRQGTAEGRIPSATDPEQRHGRKSKSKRFTGHKASVAVDQESQIIVGAEVLSGDAPDATDLKAQVEAVEQHTGQSVAETVGDCAYGSGELRQEFAAAQRVLIAKVPQEHANGGLFPKSAFRIDLHADTVTCPGGVTSEKYTLDAKGGKLFHFGAACATCPLRDRCTTAKGGRQVRVHPQEELLQQARAFQESPEGKRRLQERVVVEHRLARLGQLGIGQARYRGKKKTHFQLLIAATVANLRWTWNWQAAQATPRGGSAPPGGVNGPWRRFWRYWRLQILPEWHRRATGGNYRWKAAGNTWAIPAA